MNKIIYLSAILFSVFYINITKAEEVNWMVSQMAGDAIIKKPGYQKKRLELYDYFGAGDIIATSANGTVGLTRNDEAMVISANSIIELPQKNNSSQITLVFQKLGTTIFSAKKRNRKHFEVRTPYSAAIVKGTTFAVSVDQNNSQLQVFEGAVQLNGKGREESYIVKAGNKSITPRETSKRIRIQKVTNSSAVNPHFGSDVSKLILNYAEKIEIGNVRRNDFSTERLIVKNKTKSTIGNVNKANNKNKPKTNKSKYITESKSNRVNTGNSKGNSSASSNKSNGNSNSGASSSKSNGNSNASSNNGNGKNNSSASSNNGNGNGKGNSAASSNNGKSSSKSNNGNGKSKK